MLPTSPSSIWHGFGRRSSTAEGYHAHELIVELSLFPVQCTRNKVIIVASCVERILLGGEPLERPRHSRFLCMMFEVNTPSFVLLPSRAQQQHRHTISIDKVLSSL